MAALNLASLLANNNVNDLTSYPTATLTPASGRPVLAAIGNEVASGTPNTPTLSGGGLTTWTLVATVAGGVRRVSVFLGTAVVSPTGAAVTIDFAGQTQACAEWAFYDVQNARVTGPTLAAQFQTATAGAASTSISATLAGAANAPSSRCFAAVRQSASQTLTPRTSWSALANLNHGSPSATLATEWRSDAFEATGSASYVTAGASQMIVVELLGERTDATVVAPAATASAAALAPGVGIGAVITAPAATATADAPPPALIVHSLPSAGSGWGSLPWGTFPWGPRAVPFLPGTLVEDFPGELPPLEHVIIGPNGATDYPPVVGDFSADEDVGFSTLAGTVERQRALDQPDIYTDGAQWVVTDAATGHLVAAGDLLDPSFGSGAAQLKADGWAKRLARRGERLLYQSRGYGSLFVLKNSEPYGPQGRGFYVHGEDKFQCDTNGALRWKGTKGSDAWSDGDVQGFVAYFGGLRPGVRRLTGHIHSTVDGVNFLVRANTTPDQVTPPAAGTWVTLHDFTPAGHDVDFDVDLPVYDPVLIIEAIRTTGGTSYDLELTLTNLAIYGIASGDDWTGSDVARDIAGRLGFATDVDDTGFPVLPLDGGVDGLYQDVLDAASLLSGSFYRVTGRLPAVPVLEWHPLGSRVWQVLDPEFPRELVPLPRFDSVLVPYTLSNGVAQDLLEVTSDAIGQDRLPVSRSYGPLSLPDPLPNADGARLLGQQALGYVYPRRFAGQVSFSRVASPEGGFVTGHLVHSGDALMVPVPGRGMYVLPTASLHRDGGQVTATFDDGIAAVDRLVARKARAILLKSPS